MGKYKGKNGQGHRKVWMEAYGPIPDECVIHHRNENPSDNRLTNLELMTYRQHAVHHNEKHARAKDCVICDTTFEPHPTKRKRQQTCSRDCMKKLQSQRATEQHDNAARDEQIRHLVSQGMRKSDVARVCNLSPASITRICKQ